MAESIELPLTHLITINFALTDIAPEVAVEVFQRLRLRQFNKWATRPPRGKPGCTPTYAYVFENERDGQPFLTIGPGLPHNVHVHWSLHIPAERLEDFRQRIWEWLDAYCTRPSLDGAVHIRAIHHAKGLRSYALKGVQQAWAAHFGASHAGQGLIIGRRTGTSLNLGLTARLRHDRRKHIRRRLA